MQSTESDITLDSNNIVTSKVFVCTVRYYYDAEDSLVKKRIQFANGSEHTVNYEKAENDSQVVRFTAGGRTVTSHSKTDSFGRKEFDELQLGTASISRQFYYHAGVATDEHKNKSMVKSAPTTQLVSRIVLSNGRTLSYEYDEEERITRVEDSVDGITTYTYDELGQLLTETVNDTVVNTMTYDNYGNIKTKNGAQYVYGNGNWKDLLTSYNGQAIVYDAQGNPVNYLGHTLTWGNGRKLKKFVKSDGSVINYTYNANGIRTSKTVDGVRHDYVLDGAKILREAWNYNETTKTYDDVLVPLYDNEDSVCGIEYNGTAYYFLKNQQGDIIAITDSWGSVVARYTYDAWGVCTVADDTSGCDIANINQFRYRGYYYDKETSLYYLQSRYYDSVVGRFVNADAMIGLSNIGTNLYSYCCNDSVNHVDPTGLFFEEVFSLNWDQLVDFTNKVYDLEENKRGNFSTVLLSLLVAIVSGAAAYFFCEQLGTIASVAGTLILIYDVILLLIPSYKKELKEIAKKCRKMYREYEDTKCTFNISLLFGTHSNEFKLEAYKKGRFLTISNCGNIIEVNKQLAKTSTYAFRWNGIYNDLRDILISLKCYPTKHDVTWQYSYS